MNMKQTNKTSQLHRTSIL